MPRANGRPIPGPLVMPVVSHGLMSWTQSTPDGNTELHVYTLATQTDQVIDRQHPAAAVFAWPLMVWAESLGKGGLSDKLVVASAETGERLPTPAVLADVLTPMYLAGAPGILAWVANDNRTIWLWHLDAPSATRLYVAPAGEHVQFPSLGNQVLAWVGNQASHVYDLRAGGPVVQVTPQYGFAVAKGNTLAVSYNVHGKSSQGDRVIVVNTNDLPPPSPCD